MESRRCAYIEIKIGVMHVMKPPEDWNHVVRPMPPPICVIHQQKRGDGSDPKRESEPVQKTEVILLCPYRDCDRDWQHGQTHDGKARNREHKIAYKAMQHAEMLPTQRETPLQPEQCEE